MKRTLLFVALAFAMPPAFAAADEPKSAAAADAKAAANPHAAPAPSPASAVDTTAARAELAELRTQMQELSRKMAKLSGELGDVGPRAYAYRYIGNPDRGMIGVVLAKDEHGLRVTAVTPGGPAAKAGIKNGDVIVKVRGDLEGPSGDSAKFLNEALRNLKVDQEVILVVQRDGKPTEIKLKAERREPYNFADAFGAEMGADGALPADFNERMRTVVEQATEQAELGAKEREQISADVEQARTQAREAMKEHGRAQAEAQRAVREAEREAHRAMPWWGLNLAPVNPELGRYFGTDKGALVISADNASLPGLRGGDVITSVAGERVERPEDALRALRDQPSGKDVAIKLMRDHKTLALNVKAPEFKSIFGVPPMPPMPAMPATPATPPMPAPRAMPAPPPAPATPAKPAEPAPAIASKDAA
jgi:membrane-associated protease RseP (regulator of RpoE activity)